MTKHHKRRTLRQLSIEELKDRYDRVLKRAFEMFRRADKLRLAIERRERPIRKIAETLS